MAVPTALTDLSATAASNSPTGSESVGSSLDDYLRGIQAVLRGNLAHKGSDIASATTADLGAVVGLMHDITGTTTITGFGTVSSGIHKVIKFEGALTLTHNATSLILPGGANITTADGDIGWFISEGSGNWRCIHYTRASGKPVVQITSGTKVATTSGTEHDFTSIPAWVKKITLSFSGISLSGSAQLLVQLGDSGGVETTDYASNCITVTGAATSATDSTSGFILVAGSSGDAFSGSITFTLMDVATNTWVASGSHHEEAGTRGMCSSGRKALSATLDRLRLTTSNGTDTFDAGAVNVLYE
jgi:hypothetical protein